MDTETRYRIEFAWRDLTLYFTGEDWSCDSNDARTYTTDEALIAVNVIRSTLNVFTTATIRARSL